MKLYLQKVVKLLLQFKSWLYFSILPLHTKYEPYKPSRTPSNRLLNDKTASNALEWKKNAPMALRLVMRWLYFSILALHTKYEPCKPSRTLSNRLLNDKTASNGLKNSLKIMFEASTDLNFFFSILASKTCSWKPRRKKSQPREIWAQSVPWNPFKQAFKGQNSLKQPQKQPQNYVWGQLWNLHEKSGIFFISLQYLMVLDLMEWFRLTSEVKSTLSQTFRWGLAHSIY